MAVSPSTAAPPAPIERRDLVNRVLVDELGLLEQHRKHLLAVRGLPALALEGFASAPAPTARYRREIAARIIERVGDPDGLHGTPGFYMENSGTWAIRSVASGILVPVPDARGRIQALLLRADVPLRGGGRFVWLSSRGLPGGASPGAPVAVWRPEFCAMEPTWISEGALKAAIAAWHMSASVLGVPGVTNWRDVLPDIPRRSRVVVAFDMDAATNPVVARHREDLARALYWRGNSVEIATWDSRLKGIDDALLADAEIDRRPWPTAARRRQPSTTLAALRRDVIGPRTVRLSEVAR